MAVLGRGVTPRHLRGVPLGRAQAWGWGEKSKVLPRAVAMTQAVRLLKNLCLWAAGFVNLEHMESRTCERNTNRVFGQASNYPLLILAAANLWRTGLQGFAIRYCNFAYSALACFRMGMSGSASFQSVRKS